MKHARRLEALQHWAALTTGAPGRATLQWIAAVSKKVLEADRLPAEERRQAMVTAVGLAGQVSAETEIIRAVLKADMGVVGDSAAATKERRKRQRTALRSMLAPDLVNGGPLRITDANLNLRIRRATAGD